MTDTDTHGNRWSLGRLQIGYHLWIHHYATASDRWVFQPYLIWDRK